MAKRSSKSTSRSKTTASPQTGPLERQVLAFAEQLGYVAGSIQSRTEGLVDRKALSRQVASVRDGAKQLLDQLATGVASRVRRRPAPKKPVRKARSGGAGGRARGRRTASRRPRVRPRRPRVRAIHGSAKRRPEPGQWATGRGRVRWAGGPDRLR
jgi:hypothetical protein